MKISIGPLRYDFIAHDEWGRKELGNYRQHFRAIGFSGNPGRIVHLLRYDLKKEDFKPVKARRLPPALAAIASTKAPRFGWSLFHDNRGFSYWRHSKTAHSFWTMDPAFYNGPMVFQIPWPLFFEDILRMGGGLMHAGLAEKSGQGIIFSAPSGGGKTTALSRLPKPWRVLADDAVLIWPEKGKGLQASPLPTWGGLVGTSLPCPTIRGKWANMLTLPLAEVAFIKKNDADRLLPFPPPAALPELFRALCEHPMTIGIYKPHTRSLFRLAARIARGPRLWILETTRRGRFWKEFEGLI